MSPGEWNASEKKDTAFRNYYKKKLFFIYLSITNEKIFFFGGSLTLSSCLDEGVGRKYFATQHALDVFTWGC